VACIGTEESKMHLLRVEMNSREYPTAGCYPFNIGTLNATPELAFRRPVAFFVGENGTGKSTLLDAITRRCGIHIWDKPRRHLSHSNPYETKLADYLTVTWANGSVPGSLFRAETFREFADFLDDVALCDPGRLRYHGGRILNTLSHGQAILSYFSGRYHIEGLYLLDEPESALSPRSQVALTTILREAEAGGHAQFIMATHSPILLAYPGAQVFSFDSGRIEEVEYEDTAHYRLYKQFFEDPGTFLDRGDGARELDKEGFYRPTAPVPQY
jgi:predicted ATPase